MRHGKMVRKLWISILLLPALAVAATAAAIPGLGKPRLVVLVAIDQFRYDYLTRFNQLYRGGLRKLWERGAVFTNAYLMHYPTATAVGHASMLTGATPAFSGIIGNSWYERTSQRSVGAVEDSEVKLLGASEGTGASPRRLMATTLGDELKIAGGPGHKVIGISFKDRAAILMTGRMADAAYWYDSNSGNMVSSTYYMTELPGWVKEFNAERLPDKYLGAEWKSSSGKVLMSLPKVAGPKYYTVFEESPFANDYLLAFARRAIAAEKLGADELTDILCVSLSTTDAVGHDAGPDSEEIRELNIYTDRSLGRFLEELEQRLGRDGILVVFTADHGVAPLPEVQEKRRLPGGRFKGAEIQQAADAALDARFGPGDWIEHASDGRLWLNLLAIRRRGVALAEAEEVVAERLREIPEVFRVYTASALLGGRLLNDPVGKRVAASYYPGRSPEVIAVLAPHWLFSSSGTSHGTPYSYDTHVPVILMGPWFRPGLYHHQVAVNDIAPTLAAILAVPPPSGSVGRVLVEALAEQVPKPAIPKPAAQAAKK